MSNREEFEQLEDIKDILNDHKIFFNEKEDRYQAEKITGNDSVYYPSWEITYMNGAWYTWQEQQKKIDVITKQRDSFIKAHHIAMNDVCENKAKIDELQKLRSLDEMAINQLAQANQVWRTKCDELQARIDEVLIEMKNQLGDEDFYDMERPDYDAMLYALRNIKDILKGNKDEN